MQRTREAGLSKNNLPASADRARLDVPPLATMVGHRTTLAGQTAHTLKIKARMLGAMLGHLLLAVLALVKR